MATSPAAPLHLPPIYLDLETMAHQYITLPQLPWENPPPKSPQPTWGLTIASSSRQPQRLPAVCSNIAAWASQHRRAVFCHTAVPNFNRRCAILIWKFQRRRQTPLGEIYTFFGLQISVLPTKLFSLFQWHSCLQEQLFNPMYSSCSIRNQTKIYNYLVDI